MISYLKKRWFLTCLVIVIPVGFSLGLLIPREQIQRLSTDYVGNATRYIVAFVLFLMSVTLDIRKLTAAMKAPAPVFWACVVNFAALPLVAIPLSKLQLTSDFAVGLIITACVPSTMASASVWTRKAKGNDAISLLCTIITNGLCFLVTPFWLSVALGDSITLDTIEMIERLFYTALIPIACGQVARTTLSIRTIADDKKTLFGSIAQVCILTLVLWASVKGGGQLQVADSSEMTFVTVIVIFFSCIMLHVFGLAMAFYGGQVFRFKREDIVATVFSGSQKTLPIGIFIATDLLANRDLPFAAFPILMFHASQLIMDTLLIEPLGKWAEKSSSSGAGSS